MDKTAYVVTESAGPKVAGRRATPGDELRLTEFEARAELLAGSLRPKESKPAAETIAEEPVEEVTADVPRAIRRRS